MLLVVGLMAALLAMHGLAGAQVAGTSHPVSAYSLGATAPDGVMTGAVQTSGADQRPTPEVMNLSAMDVCAAIIIAVGLLLLARRGLQGAWGLTRRVVDRPPGALAPAPLPALRPLAVLRI